MHRHTLRWSSLLILTVAVSYQGTCADEHWRFVSMPDFVNVDLDYPQTGWEESLDFILDAVSAERPDFLLVAGDLVMGHWHSPKNSRTSRAKVANSSVGSSSVGSSSVGPSSVGPSSVGPSSVGPSSVGPSSVGKTSVGKTSVSSASVAKTSIEQYATRYYNTWKARMAAHKLKWFAAIGDHELGDNPWLYPQALDNVAAYKRAFHRHLGMPENGPSELQGTAFYWVHKRVLFVSVDVFEPGTSNQGQIRPGVTGTQLAWLKHVIDAHPNVDHVIVMGHAPCLGPVRQWSSSGLMITGGRDSKFWHVMADTGVALYLCGEVHAITCTARDGVQQIAHGGLIGYNTRTNYLVVDVYPGRLELTLKEIDLVPSGEKLWQPGTNRPLERVNIQPEIKQRGFIPVGTETIDTQTRPHTFHAQRGYFLKKFETSTDRGRPVFINGGKPLPRINLDGTVTK